MSMYKRLKKGYIQVYTGNGKGKTTAALGQSLRSWGHGLSICIIQFMKKNNAYGECKAALKLGERFLIRQFGRRQFIKNKVTLEDKRLANRGLEFAKKNLTLNKYDVVVLDEINCAMKYGLIESSYVKALLDIKPVDMELILTGRYAPGWLMRYAHLVTEMKEKKHYFRDKILSRRGIEF